MKNILSTRITVFGAVCASALLALIFAHAAIVQKSPPLTAITSLTNELQRAFKNNGAATCLEQSPRAFTDARPLNQRTEQLMNSAASKYVKVLGPAVPYEPLCDPCESKLCWPGETCVRKAEVFDTQCLKDPECIVIKNPAILGGMRPDTIRNMFPRSVLCPTASRQELSVRITSARIVRDAQSLPQYEIKGTVNWWDGNGLLQVRIIQPFRDRATPPAGTITVSETTGKDGRYAFEMRGRYTKISSLPQKNYILSTSYGNIKSDGRDRFSVVIEDTQTRAERARSNVLIVTSVCGNNIVEEGEESECPTAWCPNKCR